MYESLARRGGWGEEAADGHAIRPPIIPTRHATISATVYLLLTMIDGVKLEFHDADTDTDILALSLIHI